MNVKNKLGCMCVFVSGQTTKCSVDFICEKSSDIRSDCGNHNTRLGFFDHDALSAAILQRYIAFRHRNGKLMCSHF